jgi:hypothetical protein
MREVDSSVSDEKINKRFNGEDSGRRVKEIIEGSDSLDKGVSIILLSI